MRDCADHYPNGAGAVAENFFATGSPVGTHSPEGWPSFAGWPRDESLTHEGTYWKWIERAWRSGLRIMVNDLVENRALCELYPLKQNSCNEMASAYKQADDMYALQDYIDAQFGGPGKGFLRIVKTPAEARKVINAGKLAMVLGVEVSEVLDCGQFNGVAALHAGADRRRARQAAVDRRAVAVPRAQVRQRARRHALRLRHDRRARQHRQQVRHGPVLDRRALPDGAATTTTSRPTRPASTASCSTRCSARRSHSRCCRASCPVYPPAPHCNPKGLTPLGEHLIRSMMRRGMIVETDHLSVKARQEALTILEADGYPGVISSHSWGDAGQPEAHPAPRRPDRADLARGQRLRRGVARGARLPRPALPLRHRLRLGHQRAARPARAATERGARTPSGTRSARSTAAASSTASARARARTTSTPTAWTTTGSIPTGSRTCAWSPAARSSDDMANGAEAYLQLWERSGRRPGASWN